MTDRMIALWSEARQVAEQAGLQPALWPAVGVAPQSYFETLRGDGRAGLAELVMAAFLPRLEAIEWMPADDSELARALDLSNQVRIRGREALSHT